MRKMKIDWHQQAIENRKIEIENNDKINSIKNNILRAYYKVYYESNLECSPSNFTSYFEVTYKGYPFVCDRLIGSCPTTLFYGGVGVLPNGTVTRLYYNTFKDLVDIQVEQRLKESNKEEK